MLGAHRLSPRDIAYLLGDCDSQQCRRPRSVPENAAHNRNPEAAKVEQEKGKSPIVGFIVAHLEQLKQFFGYPVDGDDVPTMNSACMISFDTKWLLDSVCNEQITMNETLLYDKVVIEHGHPVKIPNGASIHVRQMD
ncbi:unnamed protein product [Linum trigynum]|uniref:Uncharacterized protein n=1 Tax=Linum trigynum TaxID=586398 RepID=A0AAV2EDQ1_9ROSI